MKKIIAVLFVLLFCSANAFAFGSKFKDEVKKEQGAVKLVREVMRGGYDVITASELHELLQSGQDVLVIDTMPFDASYKKAHIPGAKQFLFPIPDMNEWNPQETAGKSQQDYEQLLGKDKDRKIVVYCGFVKCTRSHNGAVWAKKLGYTNVLRFSGGIFAWKGADYELEKVK